MTGRQGAQHDLMLEGWAMFLHWMTLMDDGTSQQTIMHGSPIHSIESVPTSSPNLDMGCRKRSGMSVMEAYQILTTQTTANLKLFPLWTETELGFMVNKELHFWKTEALFMH